MDNIQQCYVMCRNLKEKYRPIQNIYGRINVAQAIIFCLIRKTADWLASKMVSDGGHSVAVRSGDLTVDQCLAVLDRFRTGLENALITTNVLSRGTDVEQDTIVVNFDLPMHIRTNADCETSYLHPPLFLQQDLNCVEEKISAYKSYTMENLRMLRKQLLKQCLSDRLVDTTPSIPKYEAQLVVTRIGISCTCRSLQAGEVCSELDDIAAQRWTEFMGNDGNGYYAA